MSTSPTREEGWENLHTSFLLKFREGGEVESKEEELLKVEQEEQLETEEEEMGDRNELFRGRNDTNREEQCEGSTMSILQQQLV